MLEDWSVTIRVIVEKYFIPIVISVVVTLLISLYVPSDYWVVEKIGEVGFFILVVGIIFLLIELLLAIHRKIRHWQSELSRSHYLELKSEKEYADLKEKIRSRMDNERPYERDFILRFVLNGNEPIRERGFKTFAYGSLCNEILLTTAHDGQYFSIKLQENYYLLLKEMYDEEGTLSHFRE